MGGESASGIEKESNGKEFVEGKSKRELKSKFEREKVTDRQTVSTQLKWKHDIELHREREKVKGNIKLFTDRELLRNT